MTCSRCGREGARGFEVGEAGPVCVRVDLCDARIAKVERAANAGRCIDCVSEGVTSERKPAVDAAGKPRPGNRCITHWRARRKVTRHAAHVRRVEKTYGLTERQYWALYAVQGGRCFGCRKATGKTKRLAVDHDHELAAQHDHDVEQGCVYCVRCLLCGPCNQIIGRLDVAALLRLVEVLTDPPARKWLAIDA